MDGFEKDGYWWFNCGCKFQIIGGKWGSSKTPKLRCILDKHNVNHTINFDCPATWELLSKGFTKGVFQLESPLGRQWCKNLKPENLENMAALGALLRPGCLRAKDYTLVCKDCHNKLPIKESREEEKEKDYCQECGSYNVRRVGVSMTEHYCKRKNREELVERYHESIDPILEPTYNVLCIHEDTNISLSDGSIIPIKNLHKGLLIDSFNEKTLKIEPNICQGVGFSKIDNGIKIILENNSYIVLTNDHDVFTLYGIKQAGKLNIGDFVYTSNVSNLNKNTFNITDLGNNKHIAYIFGQILGDGNFGYNICCGNNEIIANKLVDFINKNLTNHKYKKYWHCRSWYISLYCEDLLNNNDYGNRKTKWRYILESYGLTNSCKYKYIDNRILSQWDIESKIAFLAGVIESDGHLGNNTIHITSSSKFVIDGLKQLLLQFNIPSYINKNYNRIYPRNIKKLIKLINPYLLYKKYNGNLIDDSNYGSYPKHILLSQCKEEKLSKAKFAQKYGISKQNLILIKNTNNIIKYGIIKKVNYNTGDVRPLRIKAIEKIEKQIFYKMSVENNHSLVGNGFIIKNCYQEQSMQIAQAVANFNLKEADVLRKAIGKKLPEEMAKVKKLFIEKSKEAMVISEDQAEEIFGWIEKSQRYSFNKCIRGNTIIRRAARNKHMLGYGYTVAHMYNIRNSIVYAKQNGQLSLYKQWKMRGDYDNGLSMCEDGRIRPNIIKDITYEGIQDVYRITLETDDFIDVTDNHKFPTPNGEKTLEELKTGDLLITKGSYEQSNFKREKKGYPSILRSIKSIEYLGTDDVYNVEMDSPNHNFVANEGIVTCNSHSASYGETGYICAFAKTHFPLAFYRKWLEFAQDKPDSKEESKDLVNEARITSDIRIRPPDIRFMKTNVHSDGSNIFFGLQDVKDVGPAQIKKLQEVLDKYNIKKEEIADIGWRIFMMYIGEKVTSSAINALIRVGALSCFKVDRSVMEYEYDIWHKLTDKEQVFAKSYYARTNNSPENIEEIISIILKYRGYHDDRRGNVLTSILDSIVNSPYIIQDTIDYLVHCEEELLGVSLTCHITDSLLTAQETHSCKDIIKGYKGYAVLKVSLEDVRPWKIKNGQSAGKYMAFIKASDNSCQLDNIVAFPTVYNQYSYLLSPGIIVYITGRVSEKGSFTIERIYEHTQ